MKWSFIQPVFFPLIFSFIFCAGSLSQASEESQVLTEQELIEALGKKLHILRANIKLKLNEIKFIKDLSLERFTKDLELNSSSAAQRFLDFKTLDLPNLNELFDVTLRLGMDPRDVFLLETWEVVQSIIGQDPDPRVKLLMSLSKKDLELFFKLDVIFKGRMGWKPKPTDKKGLEPLCDNLLRATPTAALLKELEARGIRVQSE